MALVSTMVRRPQREQTSLVNPGTLKPKAPGPNITPVTPGQQQLGQPQPNITPTVPPPVPKPMVGPMVGQRPNVGPTPPPADDQGFITDFGPGNDLRSSQINPLPSNRLTGVQGMVDAAGRAIGGGPSLSDAAAKEFDLLGQNSAERRQLGIRDIGQASARLGRLGSGMVTTDLGNLEDVLRTREEQARMGLSADVARGESSDRRANLAALSGLEGQQYGQEAGQRGELRGERGYQSDTANQAQDRRIQQRVLEEQLLNSAYGRQMQGAELGLRGSDSYAQDAAASGDATAQMLAELGRAAALKRRGTTSAGRPATDATYDAGYS